MTQQATYIPLPALFISPLNVRRATLGNIDELAALIKSQGLLQNLVVVPSTQDGYGVIAGGRRLRALQLLAKRGDIDADQLVPCLIADAQGAEIVSVAENSGREAMHPADEFEAFKRMHDDGTPVEDIAAIFGVTPLVVQRRLKLASVAPGLIDLYRAGDMSLDQVMALSITDDQALQERVWRDANQYQRQSYSLRAEVTRGMVGTKNDGAASYVGIVAYEAAGGVVLRDLFAGPDDGYMQDEKLLEQLFTQKLEAAAEQVRAEGWSWVKVQPGTEYLRRYEYSRSKPTVIDLSVEDQEAVAALDARIDALSQQIDQMQEDDDTDHDALIDEQETLEAQRTAIQIGTEHYTARQKKKAGVLMGVNSQGVLEIHRGLLRNEDSFKATSADDGKPQARPIHSEALIRKLSAHRTAALAADLATSPRIALNLLCATLAERVIYEVPQYAGETSGVQIIPQPQFMGLAQLADDLESSKAWSTFQARRTELRAAMPENTKGLFNWLSQQPLEDVLDILGFCTASCLTTVIGSEQAKHPLAELQSALGLSMVDWWQPTQASYLKHVRKDVVLDVVAGVCGKDKTVDLEKLKKGQIDIRAEILLDNTGWLPSVLIAAETPKKPSAKKVPLKEAS